MKERPAIFFDRDGTLIEEVGYLKSPDQLRLLPGAAASIRATNQQGVAAVIITNQSGLARGLLTIEELEAIHQGLRICLQDEEARLDAIYFCPHLAEGTVAEYAIECQCRKPEIGMMIRAAEELHLILHRSVLIGDSLRDIEAGRRAGCKTVLVLTGYGKDQLQSLRHAGSPPHRKPDFIASDMLLAVEWALEFIRDSEPEDHR